MESFKINSKSEEQNKSEIVSKDNQEGFESLHKTWEESYDNFYDTSDLNKRNEILNLTAGVSGNYSSKVLEDYLNKESQNLTPQEKFFIEMSIQMKKFGQDNIDSAKNIENKSEIADTISKEDFVKFIDTNEVSFENLEKIAKKIIAAQQMTPEEISIYSEKSKEIEQIIQNTTI